MKNKTLKLTLASIAAVLLLVVLFFGKRDIPLEELKNKYTSESSQFVPVMGMDVHYRDEGPTSDTLPIVLIHGTGSSLHTFDAWAKNLQSYRRVIRMDLPAYGLTGPFPDRDYSIDRYTEFVAEFMAELEVEHFVLAGNSLGGQIAWNFTLKYPEQVNKLILIDAAGYPKESVSVPFAFRMARIPVIKNIFTFITPRSVAKSSVENVYHNKSLVTDALIDRYFELTLRKGNRQAFVDRFGIRPDTTAYRNIPSIDQATLILWGEQDLLIPVEVANRFHNDLPNDTLVVIDGVGHVPMEESPNKSLQAVISFLNRK